MKAHSASLLNAILLIGLSAWGYFSSETPSMTALIPAIIGVILLACNSGVKNENKVIAHIAVVLTLIVLMGLIKPLTGALERDDSAAVARVVVMMISTVVALVFFIRSFIEARKKREKEASSS
ncbi:MAG: hypothetical protein AAGC45_09790 [Bacteroidota bacterium]